MEIEHINEDTIRVKIENSDLIERGVTFLDLLSNQKQIERFFYSILEEVDLDDEFKDSNAVTFQVMPKNNGLELFISKGANVDDDIINHFNDQANLSFDDYLTGEGDYHYDLDHHEEGSKQVAPDLQRIISFDDIEKVILLAHDIDSFCISSALYYQDQTYYLYLAFEGEEEDTNESYRELLFAKALEYGEESQVTKDVIQEHCKCIIEQDALGTLSKYFED